MPTNPFKKKKKKSENLSPAISSVLPPSPTFDDLFPPLSTPIPPEDIIPPFTPVGGVGDIGVFTDERGRPSGAEIPGRGTFLGLNRQDIKDLAEIRNRNLLPAGTSLISELEAQRQARERGESLAATIGQPVPGVAQPTGATPVDTSQAIQAGLTSVIPGIAAGAIVGGAAGAGVGAIPGAIIGGLGSFAAAARSNVAQQTAGQIRAREQSIEEREQVLNDLITDTSQNPQNAARNVILFNEQLALIDRDHAQLKLDTDRNVKFFASEDGYPELERFELFNTGARGVLVRQMEIALSSPTQVTPPQLPNAGQVLQ